MSSHFWYVRTLCKLSNLTGHFIFLGKFSTLLNDIRHKYIMRTINSYLFDAYNYTKRNYNTLSFNNIIWFFWWQGEKHMPIIVRKCLESVYNHSAQCKVIFLDKNNVKSYAKLPDYIYYKTIHGYITFTEFADILRCNLLKNYGGIWTDSTNFITGNIDYKYFYNNKLLITCGPIVPRKYNYYISTKWTVALMGGYKNEPLYIFMTKFFLLYWRYNNHLISYNLIDYALFYAYLHDIGNFKYYVDKKTPYNNPNMFKLLSYMNKSYNPIVYDKLTNNTHVFKLTYKCKFKNDKKDFYHMIVEDRI